MLLNKIAYVKGCVQMVIPLVFDNSLSTLEMLGKVIDTLNSVITNTNVLQDYYNSLDGLLEEITNSLNQMQSELEQFKSEITKQFNDLESEFDSKFESQSQELNSKFLELQIQINKSQADFENRINLLLNEFIENEHNYVNEQLAEIRNELSENNENMLNYLDNRLEEFKKMIPEWQNVQVVNPFSGELEPLQNVINDIYYNMRFEALTANEYDILNLTASEYDNFKTTYTEAGLTAFQYDFYGKKYLYKDPNLYMLHPYNGVNTFYKNVIMFNTGLLRESGSFTALQYDTLEITAEVYDNEEITCTGYDWNVNKLFTA